MLQWDADLVSLFVLGVLDDSEVIGGLGAFRLVFGAVEAEGFCVSLSARLLWVSIP